jgi:hypothetical protein
MNKAMLAAGVLALMVPVAPALAHDEDSPAASHAESPGVHEDQAEAPQRAHEEGFESRVESGVRKTPASGASDPEVKPLSRAEAAPTDDQGLRRPQADVADDDYPRGWSCPWWARDCR